MNNSEEITKIYRSVGEKINDYTDKWKIRPENLERYLSGKRLKRFIQSEGLENINGIEIIINDIIQDRISMNKDLVQKFENFNFDNNIDSGYNFWNGVGRSSIDHEKILADFYDVSLSEVDIIDTNTHRFKVNGEEVLVFTESELDIILENIKIEKIDHITNKEIEIFKDVKVSLSDLIDNEKLSIKIDEIVTEGLYEMIKKELSLEKVQKVNGGLIGHVYAS